MSKKHINSNINILSESKRQFKPRNNKEYEFKLIINSAVYDKESRSQLPKLDYLVL